MLCPHCGTDTPAPATICRACRTPFPGRSRLAAESETVVLPTGATSAGRRRVPTAGPLTQGEAFGTRYRILRELGAGGMGVVYQAWDDELGVAVALKVIRPEVNADETVAHEVEKRFKRELLLARQVTHKNVVRIHDLGEINGIKYITMPYVEGRDLRDVLLERGRLPVREALKLAKQIAAGLAAAHEAGVVHRDLKPENVMIDAEGQALIMDFGISRSVSDASMTQTSAGTVVGTLEYMAPEQARGQTVDHRADIYAFGLMVHDMITGQRRVTPAQSALTEMMQRMQQAPPPLRSVVPEVPEALGAVVDQCLKINAAERYQTTDELVKALDSLDQDGHLLRPLFLERRWNKISATIAVAALLAAGGAVWWARRHTAAPVTHPAVSVLIEDFTNNTGDPVFDGTLEQSLAIALEGSPFISVYPTRDARAIAGQITPDKSTKITEPVGQLIARREGLKVLVAGFVDPRNGGYHLGVRATDPATAKPLTAVERDVPDKGEVLKTVAAMAANVREALGESKSEMTNLAAAETATAGSLEAMQAFARGQDLLRANKFDEALRAYQEAIRLDPAFGRAYAGIGTVYSNLKQQDKAETAYREAFKHVDRMTEREKYRTLGGYYNNVVRNYDKAIENYENLVRLYPADTGGHGNLAYAYLNAGNIPKAIVEVRKFLEVYPQNRLQRYNYAMYSMYAGSYQIAIDEGNRIVAATPSFEYGYLPIAISSLALGKVEEARQTYKKMELLNRDGFLMASLGQADLEMYLGRYDKAIEALTPGIAATLKEKDSRSAELALKYVALAEAQQALGRRREAVSAADKAAELGKRESVLFSAAQVFLETGEWNRADAIAERLQNMLQNRSRAYAELISGQAAVGRHHMAEGLDALGRSRKLFDSWFVRFIGGRTYAQAQHDPEALAELELAIKRRGETTDVYFDDVPTLRYLPPAYYWLARTQEALGVSAEARKNFQRYLDLRATATSPDPLAADARRRIAP